MIGLAVILIAWGYFQVINARNKKHWKVLQEYNQNIRKEEKRRIRQQKLSEARIPGVLYLSDYRRSSKQVVK